ncbi:MAG: divalent metal cation transporter [Pirellulales bacterium]
MRTDSNDAPLTPDSTDGPHRRRWWESIGPGLITACVVIGPGSILTSSQVGARQGFSMSWIVIVVTFFMMIYMTMGARLGVETSESAGDLVAKRAGRWLAVMIGLAIFFISAAFQFGNNLGVHNAFAEFFEFDYVIVVFNAAAIAFLFGFKNLYRAVERLMMAFVALMLLSFAVNLVFARPNLVELLQGLMPTRDTLNALAIGFIPEKQQTADLAVAGLAGTTFVSSAAFFQIYLVKQKGWGREQLRSGSFDARIGSVLMALITLMILWTAAAGLRGEQLTHIRDVAKGLEPLFGGAGTPIFCLGLFCAAYSSFLVNSMIGGFILADGLGLGSKPTDVWPRVFTVAVLLTGMGIALLNIKLKTNPIAAIVAAQAVTVLAAPLVGGVMLWLSNRHDILGDEKNRPLTNILAIAGLLLLLALSWFVATAKVIPTIKTFLS